MTDLTDGTDRTVKSAQAEAEGKCQVKITVISRHDLSSAMSVKSVMSVRSVKSLRETAAKAGL